MTKDNFTKVHQHRISAEKDPFKRIIYAQGFDLIDDRHIVSIALGCTDKKPMLIKVIDRRQYNDILNKCNIFVGYTLTNVKHEWVREDDGSADLFRNFIGTP